MLEEFMQSPAFVMACPQYYRVANPLNIQQGECVRTEMPNRAISVTVPTPMDDGHVEIFADYRVQHHLSVRPTNGGPWYHPDVTLGEVVALALGIGRIARAKQLHGLFP